MTKTLQDYLNEQKAWEDIPLSELDIALGKDRIFWTRDEISRVIDPQRARYAPRNGQTFCNIFVTDYTRAWGKEIPHKIDGEEQTADATCRKLQAGKIPGWVPCSGVEAGARSTMQDQCVVAASPGNPGHIAILWTPVVRVEGIYPRVIQAGAKCGSMTLKEGFGKQFPYVKYAYYDRDHKP